MEYRVVCNTLMPKKEDVDTYKLWLENTEPIPLPIPFANK